MGTIGFSYYVHTTLYGHMYFASKTTVHLSVGMKKHVNSILARGKKRKKET